jgi:hypothetical protein
MTVTAIFVTPGRSPTRRPSCDFQATARDGYGWELSSYSGMSRDECIAWLESVPWGQLGYRPGNDSRYTIDRERTGRPFPEYVVRFCGNWVGLTAPTRAEAEAIRDEYAVARHWAAILPKMHHTGSSPNAEP